MTNYSERAIELVKEIEATGLKIDIGTKLYYAVDFIKTFEVDREKYGEESAIDYLFLSLSSLIKVQSDKLKEVNNFKSNEEIESNSDLSPV